MREWDGVRGIDMLTERIEGLSLEESRVDDREFAEALGELWKDRVAPAGAIDEREFAEALSRIMLERGGGEGVGEGVDGEEFQQAFAAFLATEGYPERSDGQGPDQQEFEEAFRAALEMRGLENPFLAQEAGQGADESESDWPSGYRAPEHIDGPFGDDDAIDYVGLFGEDSDGSGGLNDGLQGLHVSDRDDSSSGEESEEGAWVDAGVSRLMQLSSEGEWTGIGDDQPLSSEADRYRLNPVRFLPLLTALETLADRTWIDGSCLDTWLTLQSFSSMEPSKWP